MALEPHCKSFVGHCLFVVPHYGNGWHREDLNHPPDDECVRMGPKPFNMLVEDFLELESTMIGVRGKITEKGHQYDGYWCLACLRSHDDINFVDKPGHYMIWIARNAPRCSPAAEKAIYEYVALDTSAPCLCGYGVIADSPSRIQSYVQLAAKARADLKLED